MIDIFPFKILMNTYFTSPADPYIDPTPFALGVHMLLLQAKITVEHPRDARLVRLVAFGRTVGA